LGEAEAIEAAAAPIEGEQRAASQSVTVVLQAAGLEEIKPLMCRLVALMGQEGGRDQFQLQVEGLDVVFDFPNLRTDWTPELREQVATLRGVRAVRSE